MKKGLNKKIVLILLIMTIVFLGYTFLRPKGKEAKTYKVVKKNIKEELTFSGKIDAQEKAILSFQTSGRLAWVGVKEGDWVKKFQGIASLDQKDLKNRLDKYLNIYTKQRNNFEQGKDDYEKTWTTASDKEVANYVKRILENNQYDLNNAVLDVEYQNFILQNAYLWSPIEGIVTKVEVPIAGVNITPTNAEFEIVNPKTIFLSALADQTEVINLKEGMKGKIIFDAYPNEEIDGSIYYISYAPETNETGTVYQIKISFNSKMKLRLGMTADITFVLKERKNVIALPKSYLKNDKKGNYVQLKINKQIKKQYVKTGEEINDQVIINSGLKINDLIVL